MSRKALSPKMYKAIVEDIGIKATQDDYVLSQEQECTCHCHICGKDDCERAGWESECVHCAPSGEEGWEEDFDKNFSYHGEGVWHREGVYEYDEDDNLIATDRRSWLIPSELKQFIRDLIIEKQMEAQNFTEEKVIERDRSHLIEEIEKLKKDDSEESLNRAYPYEQRIIGHNAALKDMIALLRKGNI